MGEGFLLTTSFVSPQMLAFGETLLTKSTIQAGVFSRCGCRGGSGRDCCRGLPWRFHDDWNRCMIDCMIDCMVEVLALTCLT